MNSERDCEHGQLKRSCEICESEREIAELRTENAELRDRLEAIAKAQGEPVAWRINHHDPIMGGAVFTGIPLNEQAMAALDNMKVTVTPLYTATPSPAADVLVEALTFIATGGGVGEQREIAQKALAAYEKERQK